MVKYGFEGYRTPLSITLSVWKALFLREAVSRVSQKRTAWIWLLLDPIIQIILFVLIFTVIRLRVVGGIDTPVWLMTGLLAYNMFRTIGTQIQNAVTSNQALFTYRQVKPIDTVISRAFLEGLIGLLVAIILFLGSFFFEFGIMPADPLLVFTALFGMWLMGIGFGLVVSVLIVLVPILDKVIKILMMPLYFCSGVIFPLTVVPLPYRDWLVFNPLLHGVEAIRLGFAPYYHAVSGLNLSYLYVFALANLFLGLMLYRVFSMRMVRL